MEVGYTGFMNLGTLVLGLLGLALGLWAGMKVRKALEGEGDVSTTGRLYKRTRSWALKTLLRRGRDDD